MNRILHLIKMDIRQISRDSMLALAIMAPLLLLVVVRYGIPILTDQLNRKLAFDLTLYYDLMLTFVIVLIPLLLGVLTGFMMLDERDENIIQYYAVTPLQKSGYFLYRLTMPVVLSILFTFLLILYGDIGSPTVITMIPTVLLLALEAPILTLVLVAFANNKIEGLALSKGLGIIVFIPVIAYFVPFPWQLLAGFVPTYWASQTFLLGLKGEWGLSLFFAFIGLAVHVGMLRYLYILFLRKVD